MSEPANNGLRWRVDNHEDRIRRIESFELAVMSARIKDLDEDVRELRSQLKWQTRALIGAMLTMLATLTVVLLVHLHG